MQVEVLSSCSEVADALRSAEREGVGVRIRGGETKMEWGSPGDAGARPLSTAGLNKVLEHNAGDLTAVVQAGVRLAEAQEIFAQAGQMLAVDPPLGLGEEATVGGVVATADSGPLRHAYGGVRDLVIGLRAALSDGTVVHSGGKVIKNVAGYDLGKLFTGSFGTLGVIVEVSLRLHPLPSGFLTVAGRTDDPESLGEAALRLANSPLRGPSLDFSWEAKSGMLLARFSGGAALEQGQQAKQMMEETGLEATIEEDDHALWAAQRAAQRSMDGVVLKVSALPAELAKVIRTAEGVGATAAGRAGVGTLWLNLEQPAPALERAGLIGDVRRALEPRPVVIQDAPAEVRQAADVWGRQAEGTLKVMRRLKELFDPSGVCNRGIFVGGI